MLGKSIITALKRPTFDDGCKQCICSGKASPREQIAKALSTLSGYLDLYLQGGLPAVVTPIAKPGLRLLTDPQLDQLKGIVLNKSPETFQKKRMMWTLNLLVEVVKERFLASLSVASLWRYLRKLKLSHQKATRSYLNEDQEEIRLYAQGLLDRLIRLPADAQLIFMDEFSVSIRPSTHYIWGQQGQQPQIASDERHRFRTNGFVRVDAFSGQIDLLQSKQAKAEQVA